LEFQEGDLPYFKIIGRERAGVIDRMRELGIEGDSINVSTMEDVLLGPMEDLGVLERLGLVDLEEVYEAFETYFLVCTECKVLKQYFEWSRSDVEDDDVYDNLLTLGAKLKAEGEKIRIKKRWRGKI
jgi:hypothetical protein